MTFPESQIDFYPLSFEQERFWFLDQLNPGNPAYNERGAVRLLGSLDVAKLTQSINEIIKRHAILRTQFVVVDGQPRQMVTPFSEVDLQIIDLLADQVIGAVAEREREALRLATRIVSEPCNLAQGPLWRIGLLRIHAEEHLLVLMMHHIISDGDWSIGLFFQEMVSLYEAFSQGQDSPLTAPTIQYHDYARWQRQTINDTVLASHLAYWRQQLAGELPTVQLPLDRPRQDRQQYPGAAVEQTFPQALTAALHTLSQDAGVPLFVTLLTGFNALLYRYTGQTDICVGAPAPGRNHLDTKAVIGYFGNPVVLRTDTSDDPTFRELLARVHQTAIDALNHQDCPFDKVVEALKPKRTASLTPLFQILVVFRDAPQWLQPQDVLPTLEVSGLTFVPWLTDKSHFSPQRTPSSQRR